MDNKVITNKNNTKVIAFVIGGETYTRETLESYNKFYKRVEQELYQKGIDLTSVLNSRNFTKERQEVKQVKQVSPKMKKRIIATAVVAVLGLATVTGCSFGNKNNDKTNTTKQVTVEEKQNYTNNAELNKSLVKLAATEEGEQIVSQLLEVNNYQITENDKLLNKPDAEGNVLFYESREVLSMQDYSNAGNHKMMALDYNDTRVCDYIDASYVAIRAMYVTGDSNNEHKLIKDKETRKKMKYQEKFAEAVMAGKKSASEIDAHFEELMETGLTYSEVGVNTAYLGEADSITLVDRSQSKKLNQFIEYVTKNNKGINNLQDMCVAKSKAEGLTEEQYDLIAEALVAMDKENIKVEKESRDRFDASTTEKGKLISQNNGTITNETKTTTKTMTKTERKKISEKEVDKKFTKAEKAKAIKEADDRDVIVDTDGDGKKDSTITEANKKEEQKKEELEKEAASYEADYAQGQSDGYYGNPKAKNTPGYNAGYANGQKRLNAEKEADKVISEEVIYSTPEPTETKTEPQKVKTLERDGEVYETTIEQTTSKVRSYNAEV